MIVDGKKIANDLLQEIKNEIEKCGLKPTLTVIVVGSDPVTERFISLKKRKAEDVGISVVEKRFKENTNEQDIISEITNTKDAIVVQLPLPSHINQELILDSVSIEQDVDVLSTKSNLAFIENTLKVLPPTTGAIVEILKQNNVTLDNKKVVVIGRGKLVGKPAIIWLKNNNADVTVVDEYTDDISETTKNADIIISGAGSPGLIKPDMIKQGVVLIDAGTSESGGKLVGDADPECRDKASIFTPVPGGVGPITIAILLRNVITLNK